MQIPAKTSATGGDWALTSWQGKPAAQQPIYPDPAALQNTLTQLAKLPPLVTSWEIENLKLQLAEAARGESVKWSLFISHFREDARFLGWSARFFEWLFTIYKQNPAPRF